MGVALGWMTLALAVVGGAPEAGRGGVPITYKVQFVEVEGLGWRDAVFNRLTPVTRQGSATVWTAPADVARRMLQCAAKNTSTRVLQAPRVTAWSGVPAHVTTRSSRQLVTQVAWNGDDRPAEAKPETVRTGSAATMSGRKLDQGILVQMVLQDTQILAVHRVTLGGPKAAPSDPSAKQAAHQAEASEGASSCCEAGEKAGKAEGAKLSFRFTIGEYQGITLPTLPYIVDDIKYFPTGLESPPAPAMGCCSASAPAACTSESKASTSKTVSVEVPEIGNQEIAGEWLIPNDGVLLVSFGPHTVADRDGKAVIRERLAIVEADEADGPAAIAPAAHRPIWGTPGINVPVVPAPMAMAPSPAAAAPAPAAIPAPAATMPPMPDRSTPQGYHADGKVAELPPLPPDEADDDAADESAETRPSPQTKKPRQPDAVKAAKPQPAADAAMKKAQFTAPSGFPAIPTLFQPMPTVGLQFLLPIKPVSFKLPFNRRLEIEIFGRVVRAPEPAGEAAVLATRPGANTK